MFEKYDTPLTKTNAERRRQILYLSNKHKDRRKKIISSVLLSSSDLF